MIPHLSERALILAPQGRDATVAAAMLAEKGFASRACTSVAQHGLVGDMKAPVDVTYLADTVVLLRYFEALGTVRRAVSVIKKRTGAHESTIREYRIGGRGLTIGKPLDGVQGILRCVPVYVGEGKPLLEESGL